MAHVTFDQTAVRRGRPGLPPLNQNRFDILVRTALQELNLTTEERIEASPKISQKLWDALQDYNVV